MSIPVSPFARYRASSLGLSDGASVASWSDDSGNGRDLAQGTAGNQPTFRAASDLNGHPAVDFLGDTRQLASGAFTGIGRFTWAAVVQFNSVAGTQVFLDGGTSNNERPAVFLSSGDWALFSGSTLNSGTAATADTAYDLIAQFEDISGVDDDALWVDGAQLASGDAGDATSINQITLGAEADLQTPSDLLITEVIVYDRLLTEAERDQLRLYFRTTYFSGQIFMSAQDATPKRSEDRFNSDSTVTLFGQGQLPDGWTQAMPDGAHIDHTHGHWLSLNTDAGEIYGFLPSIAPVVEGPRIATPVSGDFDLAVLLGSAVITAKWQGVDLVARDGLDIVRATEFWDNSQQVHADVAVYDTGTGSEFTGETPNGSHEWMRLSRSGTTYTFYTSPDGSTWTEHHSWTSAVDATEFVIQASTYVADAFGREQRISAVVDLDARGTTDAALEWAESPPKTAESIDFTGETSLPAWLTADTALGGGVVVEDDVAKLSIDMSQDGSYAWLLGPDDLDSDHGVLVRYRLAPTQANNAFFVPTLRGNDATTLPASRVLTDHYRPGTGVIGEVGGGTESRGDTIRFLSTQPVTEDTGVSLSEFFGFTYHIDDASGPVNHFTDAPFIWMRFEAIGPKGRAKLWEDGDPEPSAWSYEWTDFTQIDGSEVAFVWAHNDGTSGGTATLEISDIEVYELLGGAAEVVEFALTAEDATVSASSNVSANAALLDVSALNASAVASGEAVSADAESASVSMIAFDATVTASSNVSAEAATISVTAHATHKNALAGSASIAWDAHEASISSFTAPDTNVASGSASPTLASLDATILVTGEVVDGEPQVAELSVAALNAAISLVTPPPPLYRFFPPTIFERFEHLRDHPFLRKIEWEKGISVVKKDGVFVNNRYPVPDVGGPDDLLIEGVDFFVGGFHYVIPEPIALELIADGYEPELIE